MIQTLSGRPASQHPEELPELIKIAAKGTSYLEIGARHGDTFYDVVRAMPKGSRAVAVDLPGAIWGRSSSKKSLRACCKKLQRLGYNVTLIFGDSTSEQVIDAVREHGPFDLALIDGDHRYDGVKKDWENYGPMCKVVAFHDIAGDGVCDKKTGAPVEVPRLWQELKAQNWPYYAEYVGVGSGMGIGAIWRD